MENRMENKFLKIAGDLYELIPATPSQIKEYERVNGKEYTMDQLMIIVSAFTGIDPTIIVSKSRKQNITTARMLFCLANSRFGSNKSFWNTSEFLGFHSHASAIHYTRKAEGYIIQQSTEGDLVRGFLKLFS